MAGRIGINEVGQVSLIAKDVERATAFYRDTLGLEHLFSAGGMSFFATGTGLRIMLGPEGGEGKHGSSILYYRVSDIEQAHAALQEKTEVLEAPKEVYKAEDHALWLAFYLDSEGNSFALMQEKFLGSTG